MKIFRLRLALKVIDFGLWILGLGPKDLEDQRMTRELIALWRVTNSRLNSIKAEAEKG